MTLTLTLRNYRALRDFSLPLASAVQLLVGPNGSGKTSALRGLLELREMRRSGPATTLNANGGASLIHWEAPDVGGLRMGLRDDNFSWFIEPTREGSAIALFPREEARFGGNVILARALRQQEYQAGSIQRTSTADALAIVTSVDAGHEEAQALRAVTHTLSSIRVYPELSALGYDLKQLRRNGSLANADTVLAPDGSNAFTVLRNWRDRRETRQRYDDLLAGLRDAFPAMLLDIEFETAGRTVAARFVGPDEQHGYDAESAASGMLAWMLTAMAVLGADLGGVVAVDEPDIAIHPEAQRKLVDFCEDVAVERGIYVLFTTHSGVMLDVFDERPERVFLLTTDGEGQQPRRPPELIDASWLRQFALGQLYERNRLAPQAGAATSAGEETGAA
jgi:predicted ATPase